MSILLKANTSHQLSKALRIAQKSLLPVRLHRQHNPEPQYQKVDLPCQQFILNIRILPRDIPEVENRAIIAQICNEEATDGQGEEVMCHTMCDAPSYKLFRDREPHPTDPSVSLVQPSNYHHDNSKKFIEELSIPLFQDSFLALTH